MPQEINNPIFGMKNSIKMRWIKKEYSKVFIKWHTQSSNKNWWIIPSYNYTKIEIMEKIGHFFG